MVRLPKFVHTIYCDDVRFEVGGKTTFVGTFRDLNIQGPLPVVIPKICVVVTLQLPADHDIDRAIIKMTKDGVIIQEMVIPQEMIDQQKARIDADPRANYHIFGAIITLQNYQLDASCVLRVQVDIGEEADLMASGLKVNIVPEEPQLELAV